MFHNPANTIWKDYVFMILPIGQRIAANAAAESSGNYFPSDDDGATWDSAQELRPDNPGSGPATHLLVGMLVRQETIDDLPNFKTNFPGSDYWQESAGWTLESVLADANMQKMPQPNIP